MPEDSSHAKGVWNIAAAVLLVMVFGVMLRDLLAAVCQPLGFDDAYMFARYAEHMRNGLGMAWNFDGVATYGPTSLLWVGVVWGLSFLRVGVWTGLVAGSWVCGVGALVAMAWAIAANVRTEMLRSVWRVLPVVAVPLVGTEVFRGNVGTGMETMLAAAVGAVFVGVALLWSRGVVRGEWVGMVGVLSFVARPESAIAVVLLPVLLFVLKPDGVVTKRGLATVLGVFGLGVGLDLLGCKLYFHTALPLSFYMKGRQAYAGYGGVWHPELLMVGFLTACQLYLVSMILLTRRSAWRLVASCVVPGLVVFAYLQTVTQIMGFHSRYYVPYLAYFVVPAVLVAERWWVSENRAEVRGLWVRGGGAVVMVLGFVVLSSEAVQAKVRHLEARSRFAYEAPVLEMAATKPLPDQPWDVAMAAVTDVLVAPLPKGATVAATEVGYLGSRAGRVNVIDMAGLNDTEIALRGFDAKALLARRPDLIWMPNSDYTYMRGQLFSEPELLAKYDVYAGAAKFGLAVRKDSAYYGLLTGQMHVYWLMEYSGTVMEEYRVRSASWSGKKYLVVGE